VVTVHFCSLHAEIMKSSSTELAAGTVLTRKVLVPLKGYGEMVGGKVLYACPKQKHNPYTNSCSVGLLFVLTEMRQGE
jgi:hypothetical protein